METLMKISIFDISILFIYFIFLKNFSFQL